MKDQMLDQMDIERERGITIKLQPVRMNWKNCELNLIDTPGHVDFSYEVSRSLAAVEGAILLVDATQGVQAQTVANLYLALEQNLTIIPAINKIDLPNAEVEKTKSEIVNLLNCGPNDVFLISAKTGAGVQNLLNAVIEKIPPPKVDSEKKLRALIFDSKFDEYKGIIAYVRVFAGDANSGDQIKLLATGIATEALEVGFFSPKFKATSSLKSGEIGYIATGLKDVSQCRVGDTLGGLAEKNPLPGYKVVKPMVFAGVFCKVGDEYQWLRDGIEKLKLNDAALVYEPERSSALGFGFRCGFLGLLHLEIFQERLRREFNLEIIVTVPSVAYEIIFNNGEKKIIHSPQELPTPDKLSETREPIMKLDIFTPKIYQGQIMQLVAKKRGLYLNTEYLDEDVLVLHYNIPLATLLVDFYDNLKSISSGFASLNYEFLNYQPCDVVKLDILMAEKPVEALATLFYKDEAYYVGRKIVTILKDIMPRENFVLKIQAAINGKIIAAEHLSALRKDVTAKLYGGDYTRKRKLLEKQKKGKKKMAKLGAGTVDVPAKAFLAVLKR